MRELNMQDTTFSAPICVLACSPRMDGNSDHVAKLFAEGVMSFPTKENFTKVQILYLRDFNIQPCKACDACVHDTRCILENKDDVNTLFSHIQNAPHVFFASPIYFYHIPAIAKAFMDRAQKFWGQSQKTKEKALAKKSASVALVAARNKGENLFQGSLWSLKYFFDAFSIEITEKLLFPGFDGPEELAQNIQACERIRRHGKEVAQNIWK